MTAVPDNCCTMLLNLILILLSLSPMGICGQPCLPGKAADKKQFYHLGRQREVVISTRVGHRESRYTRSQATVRLAQSLCFKAHFKSLWNCC